MCFAIAYRKSSVYSVCRAAEPANMPSRPVQRANCNHTQVTDTSLNSRHMT